MKDFATKAARSLVVLSGTLLAVQAQAAGTITIDDERSVAFGAGLRAGYSSTEDGAPSGDSNSNELDLYSMRLYVSGSASKTIKFTSNIECMECTFGEQNVGAGTETDKLSFGVQVQI